MQRRENSRNSNSFLYLALVCVPLAYIASQCGWIVARSWSPTLGRTGSDAHECRRYQNSVRLGNDHILDVCQNFSTVLLIAELKIMFHQIKKGTGKSLKSKIINHKSQMNMEFLQHYRRILISLLGGLLVFLSFVQGKDNTLIIYHCQD